MTDVLKSVDNTLKPLTQARNHWNKTVMTSREVIRLLILALLATGVLFATSPACQEIPGRDSGVFLYIADGIVNGDIPYRDVWDHKPPAIYYIDALGLVIGMGSLWGVWALRFLLLYSAAVLGYMLLRRTLGIVPAVFGSIAWFLALLIVLEYGNLTEEFALPFQFAALYLFWRSEVQSSYSWRGFLIGVTASMCFLLKPTLIGVQLSIVIFLILSRALSRHWRILITDLANVLLGAMSVILVVFVYFASNNAIGSLLDQVLKYNFVYSATSFDTKVGVVLEGLVAMSLSGISILVLMMWVRGILHFRGEWKLKDLTKRGESLLCLSLIGLPVEFVLLGIPGRSSPHYYMAWLPIFAILSAFFAHAFLVTLKRSSWAVISTRKARGALGIICIFGLLLMMSLVPVHYQITMYTDRQTESYAIGTWSQAIEYMTASTSENDYVLMWGAEAGLNFIADRQSPSRFVYQYPLFTSGYSNKEMLDEFLNDIKANSPILIIDTSPSNRLVPPIDDNQRANWTSGSSIYRLLPEMDTLFEYIASNYQSVETIGPYKWPIYRHISGDDVIPKSR